MNHPHPIENHEFTESRLAGPARIRPGDRGHQAISKWLTPLILFLMAAMIGILSPKEMRAGTPISESQLKAAWLLNFAKLTEWPQNTFASTNESIVIGIMGDARFKEQLDKSLDGKSVRDRGLTVRSIQNLEEARECHILFLGDIHANLRDETLRLLKSSPVLTIDDSGESIEPNCILQFLRIDKKIRFNVDLEIANAARLKLHPKLLQVANSVNGKRNEKTNSSP